MGERNGALAELVAEAGCSQAGLARRINGLGTETGLRLTYDYTAVNRWINRGERPRPPVPDLLARALSERLGRRVEPYEFGMADGESLIRRALDYPADVRATLDVIHELGVQG